MIKYDWLDLEELYIEQGLSTREIAAIKGCSATAVRRGLKDNSIPTRSHSDAAKLVVSKRGGFKGANHPQWKGGKRRNTQGYIEIYYPEHPFANKRPYVLEHRLIMEKKLGRYLLPNEKVHHKDGIKDHNVDRNLELLSPSNHSLMEIFCKNCPLKKEIRLLRWQIKELTAQVQGRLPEGDNVTPDASPRGSPAHPGVKEIKTTSNLIL